MPTYSFPEFPAQALVHLIVGGTGAGKTTYSIALAEHLSAQRYSIDEWIRMLFKPDEPEVPSYEWYMARIGRAEELIARLLQRCVRISQHVVLDLGFADANHRQRFINLAETAGTKALVHHVDIDAETRWQRVQQRNAEQGDTYELDVTRDMFDFMERKYEPPERVDVKADANDGVFLA